MKRIFISDLHLDSEREDLASAFESFLSAHCRDIDELYILGDFFEVWLGDDDVSAFNQRIAKSLAALSCRVFLMHGNRDFLIGDAFCRLSGTELLSDPSLISLEDTPALLMHGDSLCTLDKEYMQARQLLRSDAFQVDFLKKPLSERAAIARQIRGESKAHTRETAEDIMDVTPSEVIDVMETAGVSVLIHGHTHRPDVHDVMLGGQTGRRYVLGDWHSSMVYLETIDDDIELRHYSFQESA